MVERMGRDIHTNMSLSFAKVGYNKQGCIAKTAQKGKHFVAIETFIRLVGIHKVERFTLADGFLAIANIQYCTVILFQLQLLSRQLATLKETFANGINAPIVENSRATIYA